MGKTWPGHLLVHDLGWTLLFWASVAFPLKLGAGMPSYWSGDEDRRVVFLKGLAEGRGLVLWNRSDGIHVIGE